MMTKASLLRILLTWTYILAAGVTLAAGLPEPDKITKEELLPLLGKQDVTVIDIRLPREWDASDIKVKSAVREDPFKPGQWLDKYPKDKMLVLYCD
jgi:rhodanese-related sulfurtransferase